MSQTVLQVENISKLYRLGRVGTGTLSHDLNRWWHRIRGKEDPYLKIGESNDRTRRGESEYVWALRDINFSIQQGEVLGIIGRNGAGKSTLLKILSKVTGPTSGSIRARGRIAALLEVGTGFHPELTGRENIYLNGTILGMSKREVTAKMDEIVDFAGVERYLDTPVKRYSSGMLVRLGFAVAAHLEPDILIVDEVLAVGDAEFQEKAVGKMQAVSGQEGRTVLFVSHNLENVRQLCHQSLLLEQGQLAFMGSVEEAINQYREQQRNTSIGQPIIAKIQWQRPEICVASITVNGQVRDTIELDAHDQYLDIEIRGEVRSDQLQFALELRLYDQHRNPLAFFSPGHWQNRISTFSQGPFTYTERITLPSNLNKGTYTADINLSWPNFRTYLQIEDAFTLQHSGCPSRAGRTFDQRDVGFIILE